MQAGRILVAEQHGSFVIKLVGDVRLTFCAALDEFFERMFGNPDFVSVIIDVSEAENIDSTTLGQLAKLAVSADRRFGFKPVIVSTNPDISRVLETMGFERVFDIRRQMPASRDELAELPVIADDESVVRSKVIEAHRVLMGLSEQNRAQFSDLVTCLEGCR